MKETVKVALASPKLKLANTDYNAAEIIKAMKEADKHGAEIILFPQMCITGATIGDLVIQKILYAKQMEALEKIAEASKGLKLCALVGYYDFQKEAAMPFTAVISDGEILGQGATNVLRIDQAGETLFVSAATKEYAGRGIEMRESLRAQSKASGAAICYCTAGPYESTTDYVFSGHHIVAYNGHILAESDRFELDSKLTYADVPTAKNAACKKLNVKEYNLTPDAKNPWVPADEDTREYILSEMFKIQAAALARRIAHINAKKMVIGISGGLDSTLAVLVAVEAAKLLGKPASDVITLTMPGFGTTDMTHTNAMKLMQQLGTDLREVSIVPAIKQHFKDINHDESVHDTTYENAQARERTQILMDVAGKEGGIVVGTGDLSELALGWCTYNGDHMSMYGVNASVPKTVIKLIVGWYIENKTKDSILKETLKSILDTPISPELLPPDENGEIAQKTEDKVGPYELHDFFIYHTLTSGMDPIKLLDAAERTFADTYDRAYIDKWLHTFYWRFFSQQFKRSCAPDGPMVSRVSLSPRGGLNIPSDADSTIWSE